MGNVPVDKPATPLMSRSVESRTDLQPLLLAHKTELIGEITQAIANDFNNIMMAISGYAELELRKLPAGDRRSLERILSNAARATALVQKLLTISRDHVLSPRPLDLNNLLKGMTHLLEQLTAEKTQVRLSLDNSLPAINADPIEIEQAILSLVVRARDAVENNTSIVITTQVCEVGKEAPAEIECDLRGKVVVLSVDHGTAQHSTNSACPPQSAGNFQSPKGVTLVAVHELVATVGGSLRCSGNPETPSGYKLYFPALERGVSVEPTERESPRSLPLSRTVLIVDDDEAVRIPAAEFLKMEGFKVLQASTGTEAINVVLQSRSPLDVLVTDLVMPKMDGHEVAKKLLEFHPGLKVLYMSGDADRAKLNQVRESSHSVTLGKPFRLDALKDQIHELLGE